MRKRSDARTPMVERRPRILLVVKGFTYPATAGGRQRNNLLLRALQSIGDVDLVAVDGAPLEDVGQALHA